VLTGDSGPILQNRGITDCPHIQCCHCNHCRSKQQVGGQGHDGDIGRHYVTGK